MDDFLRRLNAVLPRARAWVEQVLVEHHGQAIPVADAGFPRLTQYFPEQLLRELRVVYVKKIPFPPFAHTGELPELSVIERMPIGAITLCDLIVVHADMATESAHFHELCHAVQAQALGMDDYFMTYVIGAAQHGYAKNPFEVTAFDLQSLFDRGAPLTDVVGTIRADALQAREGAAEIFRRYNVPMGG